MCMINVKEVICMTLKKLPIGISDFRKIIDEDYYYADKTMLIKDVIELGSETMLMPRPRRFGKTLNLMMLKYFFEKSNEDLSYLFKDLAIWQGSQNEKYRNMQGKYPVIYLTFKDIKSSNWERCYEHMIRIIADEYSKYEFLIHGDCNILNNEAKEIFRQITRLEAKQVDYENALKKLTEYLYKYHNKKVIILIDEYDTPIHEGYMQDYYKEIVGFMKNLLSSVLKDNVCLEKAVLTGILRVAKESIFTGLNNFEVYSLLKNNFSTYFGLLEDEVSEIVKYYGIEHEIDDVKKWYNGYIFGSNVIYNPWSIISFAKSHKDGLRPYWVNTSGNELIKKLITESGSDVKADIEKLIHGEKIKKVISEDIVFEDLEKDNNALWSFLLLTGYLKAVSSEFVNKRLECDLKIPNTEVEYFYENTLFTWFEKSTTSTKMRVMLEALTEGEVDVFEYYLKEFVMNTMSYFDPTGEEPERVYQAFVIGILLNLSDNYIIKSNRESGLGRYDVTIMPKDRKRKAYIFEFKKVEPARKETLEIALQKALAQIEKKQYDRELIEEGMAADDIIKVGVAFEGKELILKSL